MWTMGIPARQWMSYSQSCVYLDYDSFCSCASVHRDKNFKLDNQSADFQNINQRFCTNCLERQFYT